MSNLFTPPLLRRRQMIMTKKKGVLIYHWNGADALVDGKWVDRVQGSAFKNMNAGYVPLQSNDGAYIIEGYNIFKIDLNYNPGLNIGRLWKIEVDFSVSSFKPSSNDVIILDFGSMGYAIHAFALGYWGGIYSNNYKGLSNDDDNDYGPRLTPDSALVVGERHVLAFGCEVYDSENDIQWLSEDGKNKAYANYPHPRTYFNRNFNGSSATIGCGFRADYTSISLKVYSIKIYNNDNDYVF